MAIEEKVKRLREKWFPESIGRQENKMRIVLISEEALKPENLLTLSGVSLSSLT